MALRDERHNRWSETKDSAANTAVTITTSTPGDGAFTRLQKCTVSVSGAASGTDIALTIKDGASGTTIWKEYFNAARGQAVELDFGSEPRHWLSSTENKALEITVAAAGASAVATVNACGDYNG